MGNEREPLFSGLWFSPSFGSNLRLHLIVGAPTSDYRAVIQAVCGRTFQRGEINVKRGAVNEDSCCRSCLRAVLPL